MSLCLDTNVLLAVLGGESRAVWVAEQLDQAPDLLVCGPVVAELWPTLPEAERWLTATGVQIEWDLGREAWRRVGALHADYARRRQRSGGGLPRRIVTDFLIGAHAEVSGHALLTLNPADYAAFTQLSLITPQ